MLLTLVVVLGLAAFLTWLQFGSSGGSAPSRALELEQPTTTGISTGRPSFTLAQQDALPERSLAEEQAELVPAVFDGSGTIAGHVFITPGAEMPARWTLTIEPSQFLEGKERAETRRLELSGSEVEFEVTGLPQAGYVVRASAVGMNSSEINVMIARGLERQYVNLKLKPAGFIDGGVTNTRGEPLDGLPVVLEAIDTHVRVETKTDSAGNFIFRDVLDNEYLLYFGSPDNPLIPKQSLLFRAPSLRMPTREIPHDSELTVTVVDSHEMPLAGVLLRGWGSANGAHQATTDSAGRATLRFLPEGQYKIMATVDTRTGRGSLRVAAHEHAEITISVED